MRFGVAPAWGTDLILECIEVSLKRGQGGAAADLDLERMREGNGRAGR